jgi:hypothetical protein
MDVPVPDLIGVGRRLEQGGRAAPPPEVSKRDIDPDQ